MSRPGWRRTTTIGLLGLAVLLAGNGAEPPAPQAATVTVLDGSRTAGYGSLRALDGDSDAVVRGVATPDAAVDVVGGVPFTLTGLRVLEVLGGSATAPRVEVRQLGRAGVQVVHAPPLLAPGRAYVLFLTRFRLGSGRPTGQYVVTGGGAGEFEERGGTVVRLDPDATDLPAAISLIALREQL